jgi:hypothetical protein
MALTRKFLSALGIEADKIDEIVNAHAETIDALKRERDDYKADADKLSKVTEERDTLRSQLEGKSEGNPYKVKYDALKTEFETYKNDQTAKETKATKGAAYRALLRECGIPDKHLDKLLKVTDLDAVELDENGKLKGESDLKDAIKTEWSDFIPTVTTVGANTANPPANMGGKTAKTKDEIFSISDDHERQVAIAENHELFGF